MSLRPAAFLRLAVILCLAAALAAPAHAQSCTPPVIVQVSGTYCAGEPITLDAGAGWATYAWSNGQTTRYMTDAPAVDTTYTVTVADGNGCQVTSNPFEHAVSGSVTPPDVDAPESVCPGARATATAEMPPDMYAMEWNITGGHFYDPAGTYPTSASGTSVEFVAGNSGTVTLSVVAYEMPGCPSGTATIEVPVSGGLPVIDAPAEICPMGSATASVAPPAGGGSWQYVNWQITGGNFGYEGSGPRTSASGDSVMFYGDGTGTTIELHVRAVDANGCETESSRLVDMRTIEAPVIDAPEEICPMGSGTASVAPPAEGGQWQYVNWHITNGNFGYDWNGPRTWASGESVMFYGDGSGNTIELHVETVDSQYCESESSRLVDMRQIEAPVINAPVEICPMGSGTASVAPPAEGGQWQYVNWHITNGNFGYDGNGPRTWASGESVLFYGDGSGNAIELHVETVDSQYCENESSRLVGMRTIEAPVIHAPVEICPMGSGTASVAPPAEGGQWQYVNWNITNGNFGYDWNGPRTWASGESVMFYGDGSGNTIELHVETVDSQYCENESSRLVNMRQIAAPVISAPASVCPNGSGTASVAPPAEGGQWQYVNWHITNGNFGTDWNGPITWASGESVLFYADGSGNAIELHVETVDAQYCQNESSRIVDVVALAPEITVSQNPIPANTAVTASIDSSYTMASWQIENGTILGDSNSNTVSFEADGSGPVTLRVNAGNGSCLGSAEKTFFLEGQLLVLDAPSTFCSTSAAKTASISSYGPASSINWTVLNGTITSGQGTTGITFTPSGLGDVTVEAYAIVNGGSASATKVLTYAPPVLDVDTGDDIACALRRLQVTVRNPEDFVSWVVSIENGVLSGGGPVYEVQANNDTDDVTLTITAGTAEGCTTTWTHTFQHAHMPELTYSPASLCADDKQYATLVDASSEYLSFAWMGIENGTWITPPPSSGAHPATIGYRPAGTDPVVLILRVQPRDLTCASDRRFTIPVTPTAAVPTISASSDTMCANGSVTLTSSPGSSYLWSNGATTQSIVVTAPGSYTVAVTNAAGCSAISAPKTITADAPLSAAIDTSQPATSLCENTPVTLTAQPAGMTYLWSNGATTRSITATDDGTYTVTVTNANGCSDSESLTLSFAAAPKPTITAGGPLSFCDSLTLTANLGENVASWQWQMVSGSDNGNRIGNTYTTSFSGTIQVVVTYTNGCTVFSDPVTFTKLDAPSDVSIQPQVSQLCPNGGTQVLRAEGGDASTTFVWSNGATGREITVAEAGEYTVTATSPNGCSVVRNATVTVNPRGPVDVTASGATTFCAGGSVTLTANEAGAQSFLWSNGATTPSISVTQSGSYTVTVVDALGCTVSSTPVQVTVNAAPPATITAEGPTTFCDGGNVQLAAPMGAYTYLWSNGATVRRISASSSGTYTVTVTNASGCSTTSDPVTVTVNVPVKPVITATDAWICPGESSTLTASEAVSYLWSNGATTRSITVTPATYTWYTVRTTDANGCSIESDRFWVNVDAQPKPVVTIYGSAPYCDGEMVTLAAPGYAPERTYLWSTGETARVITARAPGTYTVTVTNNTGCSATSDPVVLTAQTPTATVSGTTAVCAGGTATVQADLTGTGPWNITWSDGLTQNGITASPATRVVTPSATTSYTIASFSDASCTGTVTGVATVTVNPNPEVDINVHQVYAAPGSGSIGSNDGTTVQICGDPTVRLVPTVLAPGSTYAWSNGANEAIIEVRESGTYTVTMTDSSGCTATSSVTLVYNEPPAPPVVAAGGPTAFCEGGNVTLTAPAGFTYLWSNGATTQSIVADASGDYNVTITNANGCSATSAATTVTVNPPPATPAITANGPTTFCEGGSVTLTAPDGFSYAWSTGATTRSITVSASGAYGVTVTDANGCSAASAATNVIVNPLPATPAITADGPTTFCAGGDVTLTAPASASYLWSNGATTQSITVSTSDLYTVTVTNANGCSATSEAAYVVVNPLPETPVIAADGPTTFCEGGDVTLTAPNGFAYAWSNGATTQSITVNTSGAYSVTVTNVNGCSATSAATTVAVNALPSTPAVTTDGPTTFCEGDDVTLTAPASSSYLWSNGATTQSITVNTSGAYSVTVTNANGCSATSAATNVTVNALPSTPTITADGPTTFCEGDDVTLTAPLSSSYLWSNGATTQSITVNISGAYSVTVTNANGCSATSAATSVTVNALPSTPTITADGPTTFCEGEDVTLTAPLSTSYLWSNGATTQSITVNTSGAYSVTVTNANGCSATSASTNVTVTTLPSTPAITADGPTTFCAGEDVTLTAPTSSSYLWSNGATTQAITVNTSGAYSVTVTNANGCSATSAATTVTVTALPSTPAITADGPTTFCAGEDVTLTAPASTSYLWSNGATTQSITVNTSGAYSVTVTNANGCSATSAATNVTVNALPSTPTVTADGPTTFCAGEDVTLTAPTSTSYLWSNGATTQSITVNTSGAYSVTIGNANGCTATSAATNVTVNALPATPTITADGPTSLCPGTSVTLTAPLSNSYLWSNGATTQSITVNTAGSYSVTVGNANGCTKTSAPVTVTSNPATAITSHPASATISRNTPRTLTVTATGTPNLQYQWYSGTSGDTSSPLPGETGSSLVLGGFSKKGTYRYWVRVTSSGCPSSVANSNTATITVN